MRGPCPTDGPEFSDLFMGRVSNTCIKKKKFKPHTHTVCCSHAAAQECPWPCGTVTEDDGPEATV